MREMGENHNSVVVLRISPKFWWMLPIGVRDNHTKYEPEKNSTVAVAGNGCRKCRSSISKSAI